jgi:hypothetical protein
MSHDEPFRLALGSTGVNPVEFTADITRDGGLQMMIYKYGGSSAVTLTPSDASMFKKWLKKVKGK